MKIDVLDHGYVEFIEDWGRGKVDVPEAGIIEAARQSTQGSFRGWEHDAKLLEFLYISGHSTPFEFAGMTIEVLAPIAVFREWHRHRTQSYNEMSARYAPLPDIYYMPTANRCIVVPGKNTQANPVKGAKVPTHEEVLDWLATVSHSYIVAERCYQDGLAIGIPKEVARMPMPVGHYTQMRATANLRNWLAFLTLRMDPNAQWEIRQFANAVGEVIKRYFPMTWKLFCQPGPKERIADLEEIIDELTASHEALEHMGGLPQ
jgi:thymidylate synthase (FAD)